MKAPRSLGAGALTLATLAGAGAAAHAQDYRTATESRQRRGEEALVASVQFGVGEFKLRPGPERVLYRVNLRYDAGAFEPVSDYDADTRRLRVGVEGLNPRGNRVDYHDMPEQRLDLELSPAVPTELDLAFGAGAADIELGDLSLRQIDIKAGASETVVRFSRPNRIACEHLTFQVGAIDLKTEKLGNARCSHIEFKGAAGDITLDLTGAWAEGAPARVEVAMGLGTVRLRLPEDIGIAVNVDRFLTSFDQAGLRKRGSRYYSANYETAKTKIDLDVKAAMGSVEIEWAR
jgi:hypothetical protein